MDANEQKIREIFEFLGKVTNLAESIQSRDALQVNILINEYFLRSKRHKLFWRLYQMLKKVKNNKKEKVPN
eukprot:TRINITY_DN7917_c0_g1_i1.p1 TRINITY_DN7917_c0_g1~~TRINITY_DN7917_c0_g1_i1.p1  ORF type:complete len:71 (+),score=8.57 TRINITY_DN7917_c0_g1_i1:853-1065(+)